MLWQVSGPARLPASLLTQLSKQVASLDIGALLAAFAWPLGFEPAGVLPESHRAEEVPAI